MTAARLLPALAAATILLANWNNTSPGIDFAKLPHFPLTKIRSRWMMEGERFSFDGITAVHSGNDRREVVLSGVAASAKRWTAHLHGVEDLWRGDLDGNGTQDFVLFSTGPYFNGRTTPLHSLAVLQMGRDGLPVPYFTPVYHQQGEGSQYLVDLNRDGRAELITSFYDENPSDPRAAAFCSGHWVSQIHRFTENGVKEIRGLVAAIRFPFVQPWSYRDPSCRVDPPRPVEAAPVRDHGTSVAGEVLGTVRGIRNGGDTLDITMAHGCTSVNPQVIVYDQPQSREIAFPNLFHDYASQLAARIEKAKMQVRLRGVNQESQGFCIANLLWADGGR